MEFLLVNLRKVKDQDKEYLDGIMEKFSKDSGDKEPKMVMVYGLHQKETITMDNGH